MHKFRLLSLLLLLLIAACGTTNPTPGQRFVPYPEESQFLGLTNAFRAQAQTCGTQQFPAAPALTWVESVGDTAWFHSIDMSDADTENHVGASTVERLRGRGFNPGIVAEARKKTTLPGNPNDAFNIWKADPAFCASLMNPNFTVMGAGYAGHHDGKTSAYWTQILTAPTGAPSITLNPTTATVKVGGPAIPFNVILTNSTATINWTLTGAGSLSATTGATVNYTPPATGAAGKATLTATAGGLAVLAAITIDAATPTGTLTITPATATTTVGTTTATSFQAILTGSTEAIVWSLSGPGVIGSQGAFAAYIPPATGNGGTATLTAKAGALTATATITINPAGPPPTLSVAPTTATVTVGGAAIPFNATLTNSTATINWTLTGAGSISATTGATINYTPPTTGGASTATLTATAGALTASATITINAAAPGLTITPPTANVLVGSGPIQFTASTNQVRWEMTGVGTFSWAGETFNYFPPASGNGGTATITAISVPPGLTATATVTVSPAPSLTISPKPATARVGGAAIPFTATLTNSNATIAWTLNGPGTISSATGPTTSYTPPANGGATTATLTATAGALTDSVTITITTPPPPPDIQPFLTLINNFRSQTQVCRLLVNGVIQDQTMPAQPPVAFHDLLNNAARLHSEDMATNNFFSHTGSNGSTFGQRIAAQGYPGNPEGENIAAGNDSAQGAFDSWRNSTGGHCQGMMSANINEIGLGHAFNDNSTWKHYWTLVTGRR